MLHESERRQHVRFPFNRPGKVYDRRSRKYTSCLAVDVSRGGALIEMKCAIPAAQGVHLMLGVVAADRQGVIRSEQMMEVEVVRAMKFDDSRQFLAVRFVHEGDVVLDEQRAAA